jgi:lactoylglutathione lyase
MRFKCIHNNFNVLDLEKSLKFYEEALDLKPVRQIEAEDGSFRIVFLTNEFSSHQIELTWLRDRKEPYNLGDNEIHLAFGVDDFEAARAKHEAMNAVCYDNERMGIYFISDPDGYWIEILPPSVAG